MKEPVLKGMMWEDGAAWSIAQGGMAHDVWHMTQSSMGHTQGGMAHDGWHMAQGARQHGAWLMAVKWPAGWMVCKVVERYKSKKATVELGGPRKDSGFY